MIKENIKGFLVFKKPIREGSYSGENFLLHIFCESGEIKKGVAKASAKSINPTILVQNLDIIEATFKARLEEHLGNITKLQVLEHNFSKLSKFSHGVWIIGLVSKLISSAHHHASKKLYQATLKLIDKISSAKEEKLLSHSLLMEYSLWELEFLRTLGFGLKLDTCAVTGMSQDLYYVSPKTGHAVSRQGAKGYEDRLLLLPKFDHEENNQAFENECKNNNLLDNSQKAFRLTGFFLKKHLHNVNKNFFTNREYLLECLV